MPDDRALLEEVIRDLAALERASASPGEREAAARIAARLEAFGCRVRLEEERAHGGYWWPLIACSALALTGSRALSALGAAALYDDCSAGRQWLRRPLQTRTTVNVVAEAGDPGARDTRILIAHHDAAHTGRVFDPRLAWAAQRRFPERVERADRSFPVMWLTLAGPLLAALGFRRAGAFLALGTAAAMADIARSPVVPGANDNLTAVAALVAVARRLQERPPAGVRVILLSTGSEESFMEGMQGFMRRHAHSLDRERTEFLCLECLGGEQLKCVEGEGMIRMRDYPAAARDRLVRAAETAGVRLGRNKRTIAASDGLVPLARGWSAALLGSIDAHGFPRNYHQPYDLPDALDWDTLQDAVEVCDAWVRA